MAAPRLNTVYDFSSLRLHTDGSRVHQTSRNLRPRQAALSVRDSRGNWIARDAGGLHTVGKYRRVKLDDEAEHSGESFDFSDAEKGMEQVSEEQTREKKKKRKGKEKEVDVVEGGEGAEVVRSSGRATKRRKFAHDLSFLEPTPFKNVTSAGTTLVQTNDSLAPSTTTGSFLPHPSSDLLKCIHHFASTYYTERGQLFNASRLYRKEKKERRLKRLERQRVHATGKHVSRESSIAHKQDLEQPVESQSEGEISDEIDPKKGGIATANTTGKAKRLRRDMYKVMDGSALMAIGMLLQEHVAQLLRPRIPEGWEGEGVGDGKGGPSESQGGEAGE